MKSSAVDASFSPARARRHLSAADPVLRSIIKSVGPYTIELRPSPFRSLVEAIIYQQLAGRAADAIYRRFLQIYGGRFPSAGRILATEEPRLRAAGLSRQKTAYIRDLAARVDGGMLDLARLNHSADEQVVEQLVEVKGIGEWTAQMFLIFCLGRPDVLPVGDLGLRKAVMIAYGLESPPQAAKIREIAGPWRPYSSVATWYLWKSLEKFKGIG